MTIAAILILPADDEPGLLATGPCGARPPTAYVAYRDGKRFGPWRESGWAMDVEDGDALVLAWGGDWLPEGIDRARRCGAWDDTERRVKAYLAGDYSAAHVVHPDIGEVLFLDDAGNELALEALRSEA